MLIQDDLFNQIKELEYAQSNRNQYETVKPINLHIQKLNTNIIKIYQMNNQIKQKIQVAQLQYSQLLKIANWEQAYLKLKQLLILKKSNNLPTNTADYASICELSNYIAMIALKEIDYEKSAEYLNRAERYCKYSAYLTLVTYNNWGCYYKKCNNHSLALLYISKAIKIGQTIKLELIKQRNYQKIKFLADCYLNLCAILSNMGEHELALENANIAINYIEKQLFHLSIEDQADQNLINDRHNVLIIAKFNMAVELQYLKRYAESKKAYKELKQYVIQHFQQTHCILKKIHKALLEIEIKLKRKKMSIQLQNQNLISPLAFPNKKSTLPSIKSTKNIDYFDNLSSNNVTSIISNHGDSICQSNNQSKRQFSRRKIKTRSNLMQIQNFCFTQN